VIFQRSFVFHHGTVKKVKLKKQVSQFLQLKFYELNGVN